MLAFRLLTKKKANVSLEPSFNIPHAEKETCQSMENTFFHAKNGKQRSPAKETKTKTIVEGNLN
jgi:hypothetical protein